MVIWIILISLLLITGIGAILFIARQQAASEGPGHKYKLSPQVREKRENLTAILEYLKTHDRVNNNEVERLLGVSDATAERYLNELQEAEFIEQVGDSGRGVYYIINKDRKA